VFTSSKGLEGRGDHANAIVSLLSVATGLWLGCASNLPHPFIIYSWIGVIFL
jgi:hypothetical protein